MPAAAVALARQGHGVGPPTRVCAPPPREDPQASERNERYAGLWCLLKREEPVGTPIQEHVAGEGPLRLQAPSGIYAEIRIPVQPEDPLSQESCAGYHAVVAVGSGRTRSLRHRTLDFRPPTGGVLCTQVTFDRDVMGELSHPRGKCREEYIEVWTKLKSGPITPSSFSPSRPRKLPSRGWATGCSAGTALSASSARSWGTAS